jgi:methylglyoxal synthase
MSKKIIALVAHDNKKIEMAEWANYNKDFLKKFHLIATEGTADSLINITGLDVESVAHGPEGGDIKIASAVLDGKVAVLIFFIDVKNPHGHEHELQTLIRTCVLKDIPIALNRKSADFIISSSLMKNIADKE